MTSIRRAIDQIQEDLPGTKGFKRIVAVLLVLCSLSISSTFAVDLYTSYKDEKASASQYTRNVALLLHDNIVRNIQVYDFSLKALANKLANPEFLRMMTQGSKTHVFDDFVGIYNHGFLYVLDHDGITIAASRPIPPSLNLATRDYFKEHLRNDDPLQLFISRPFHSRMDEGRWTIAFSRRVNGPDGSLVGIVVGAVELDFFVDLFRSVHLPPESSISLYYRDGTLVVRASDGGTVVMADTTTDPIFRRLAEAQAVDSVERSPLDDVERLTAYRSIEGSPLSLSVDISVAELLQRWRQKAVIMTMGFMLLTSLVALLAFVLGRELNRRQRAEEALAALAATDGLTGLINRRRFDEAFELEWKRSARAEQPLSVMMIDADCFKAYNDTQGHLEGDAALIAVADALRAHKRRPADLIARYGGEEFVVVLPQTDHVGAVSVAEAMRAAVRNLRIDHSASPFGVLTVSIGVASMTPDAATSGSHLLRLADEALYQAKANGRDRVGDVGQVLEWRKAS